MSSLPRTVLVGTGRLAYQLGHALVRGEVPVVGVSARDPEAGQRLASELGSAFLPLDTLPGDVQLVLLAVSDSAIHEVATKLPVSDAVVAHTSGAADLDLLLPHTHRGVFWPIDSFVTGRTMDLRQVPIVVDGTDTAALRMLTDVAGRLSGRVHTLDAEERHQLHLAAVFMSNFPVVMAQEAQRILSGMNVPGDLLDGLWQTITTRVAETGAAAALTGPAMRGDRDTIARHLELLAGDPELAGIYRALSERVLGRYGHTTP